MFLSRLCFERYVKHYVKEVNFNICLILKFKHMRKTKQDNFQAKTRMTLKTSFTVSLGENIQLHPIYDS